jgi:tetratricopeptide (TPR) repeat protein
MQIGDAAKSEQALITSIRVSDRQYPDALFHLASVYSLQKRFGDAEPLAREAVELDASSPEAHQELARALHGLDQSEAAEASALEALRLQPDNPQTYLILANIHLKLGEFVALLGDLDKYLEISPDGAEADQARQMRAQIFERMANIQPRTP